MFKEAKSKPNSRKRLNFEVLKCTNCAGFVHVLWSASGSGGRHGLHDYRVLPWPLEIKEAPEHWPKEVQRLWLQASRSLSSENWDATVVMARSALQVALRDQEAVGSNLKQEIKDLASKGLLPPIMREWSDEVRLLGNDSAHPEIGSEGASPEDAKDVVEFLDYLLEYLYDVPKRINEFRRRKENVEDPA